MRTQRGLALVLGLAVILSLVAAVPGLAARTRREASNRQVELALDLDQADLLARSQGYRIDEVLTELRAAGLGAVAWSEADLDKLARAGDLSVYEGRELVDRLAAGSPPAPELAALGREGFFNSGYTYAFTRDPVMARWLTENVPTHLLPDRYRLVRRGDLTVLEVGLLKERALFLNLGFWDREIERSGAAALGLRVVVRPGNVTGGEAAVSAVLTGLKGTVSRLGLELSAVVFGGGEALGYPDDLEAAAAELRQLGVPLALIEAPDQLGNISQRGAEALAVLLDYQVVRVYSTPDVKLLAPSELADKATRSVKERGLRLVYLQPYLVAPERLAVAGARSPGGWSVYDRPPGRAGGVDYTPILALNVNYVGEMAGLLASEGFTSGRPVPLGGPAPLEPLLVLLLGLGPAAALGLAWMALRPRGPLWVLAGPIGAAMVAGVLALLTIGGRSVLAAQLAALLAALVFPSLAVAYLARSWTRSVAAGEEGASGVGRAAAGAWELAGRILRDLLGASGLTFAGALLIGALLGDLRFMLEFEYFRGVKLTYVVPVLAAVVYWVRYRYPDETEPAAWPRVLARLARQPIKIWHAAVAAVLGGGFVLYVGRSGQTAGLPIGGLELRFRRWLEAVLYARPRLKEIIGYPALMAGSWLAHTGRKGYLGWFLVGASVSQVSLINSFEHIRTPLLLSLVRAANGLWVGGALGLVAILALAPTLGRRAGPVSRPRGRDAVGAREEEEGRQ